MERGSATPGELRSAAWCMERLREAGATGVREQAYRYEHTYAWRSALHSAAGVAAAALGGPRGAALALGALASGELDFAGRGQWSRLLFAQGNGANAIGVVPAAGERRRTLVLVAHHDTAHTGLVWRKPELGGVGTRAKLARLAGSEPDLDVMDSLTTTPKLALLGIAAASLVGRTSRAGRALRAVAGGSLAYGVAMAADIARSPSVPGASDNATGVAGVLALVGRYAADPLPGTELVAVLPGCEESGMGGMRAWLARARPELDPATTLVLGLDTLGAGEPIVARAEGSLWPWRYREPDLDWADRGAERAGLPRPRRVQLGGWTDPLLAVHAGLPAVSLLSAKGSWFTNYHQPTDTPDRVDWDSVGACVQLAAGTAEAWSEAGPGG
jgi:hypothetical protein